MPTPATAAPHGDNIRINRSNLTHSHHQLRPRAAQTAPPLTAAVADEQKKTPPVNRPPTIDEQVAAQRDALMYTINTHPTPSQVIPRWVLQELVGVENDPDSPAFEERNQAKWYHERGAGVGDSNYARTNGSSLISERPTPVRQALKRTRRLQCNDVLIAAARTNSALLRSLMSVRLQDLTRAGCGVNQVVADITARSHAVLLLFGKRWIVESLAADKLFTLAQLDEYYCTTRAGRNLCRRIQQKKP